MNIPNIPQDLVEYLEATYPDRCPDLDKTLPEVWASTGRAQVIRFLRSEMERQQQEQPLIV